MKDHTKEYRITIATDKRTFNAMKNLALESMTTTSQLGDNFIRAKLAEHENVPATTRRYFELNILTQKSAEIVKNMQNYDEFYEIKHNLMEICTIISGKLGPIYEDGTAGKGLEDLLWLIMEIKEKEPLLYIECIQIIKKNLNKVQRDHIINSTA